MLTSVDDMQRALVQNTVHTAFVVGAGGHPAPGATGHPGDSYGPWLRTLADYGCHAWRLDAEPPGQGHEYGHGRGYGHGYGYVPGFGGACGPGSGGAYRPGRGGGFGYLRASAPGRRSARGHGAVRLAGFPCTPLPPAHTPGPEEADVGIAEPGGAGPDAVRPGPAVLGAPGKRVLDVVVSAVLLLLTAPVLLVCAVVLRTTGGPGVIFRQERVGQGGRPFVLLKFRTHRPADQHEATTRWSIADEPRMSGFCRFLRRTSLDELPQLWNVLRGDMSMVGPRPERPYFVAEFSRLHPGYAARHRMKTGVTGLAQIHGLRGDTSIEDRCRFDNAYIDTWSLWQDVCIMLRTVGAVVRPTGS